MKRLFAGLCLLLGALPGAAETLPGRLEWVSPLALSTPRSGVVREVLAGPGDRVAAGQVLARLETREPGAHLVAAQATLKAASAAREEAGRERDRTRELYDRTLLSDHDLQLAEIELIEAEAALRKAQAALADAQLQVEYSELRSPYPALVLAVQVQPGQTVVNRVYATPMITLTRADSLAVRAPASVAQAARVSAGQTLRVRVGDSELEGVVSDPGLLADPDSERPQHVIEVHFAVPADSRWRAGQPAEILLP